MHRLFSLDPDECDTIDMEAIVHSYFDPTLFSGIEPSQVGTNTLLNGRLSFNSMTGTPIYNLYQANFTPFRFIRILLLETRLRRWSTLTSTRTQASCTGWPMTGSVG